jgi:hypothetical protein
MARDLSVRRGKVSVSDLDEPYNYYFRTFDHATLTYVPTPSGELEFTPLPGLPPYPDLGFPHTGVDEYLWTHKGENDSESWYALFRRTDGLYGLYTALCDYTAATSTSSTSARSPTS